MSPGSLPRSLLAGGNTVGKSIGMRVSESGLRPGSPGLRPGSPAKPVAVSSQMKQTVRINS